MPTSTWFTKTDNINEDLREQLYCDRFLEKTKINNLVKCKYVQKLDIFLKSKHESGIGH